MMKTIKETLELALEVLEDFEHAIHYDNEQDEIGERVCCGVLSYNPHTKDCKAVKAITALREAPKEQPEDYEQLKNQRDLLLERVAYLEEQPAQQEQGDSICQENDGCPTEKAVLQRFWRGQSIPDEHYPAWFKPAQQEPVVFYRCNGCGHAYEQVHPTSCDCMEAGGFDRVEYYTSPPYEAAPLAQRQARSADTWVNATTWRGLTDEDKAEIKKQANYNWETTAGEYASKVQTLTEAKLKEKNT